MRLSHYRRNFLHRRVMLNYTNSHYVRNCLHRNVGFNTFNETEQLRTEFPASSRSAKFIYLLLNYHVHYQHKPNYMKLERILSGEPLTCIRVTPRQASLRGSWTSLPCLLVGVAPVPCQENHNYINHNFHIIHHIHSFLYYFPLGIYFT